MKNQEAVADEESLSVNVEEDKNSSGHFNVHDEGKGGQGDDGVENMTSAVASANHAPPHSIPAQTASIATTDRLQHIHSSAVSVEATAKSQESSFPPQAVAAAEVVSQLSRIYGYSASSSSLHSSNDDYESDTLGRLYQDRSDGRLVMKRTSSNEEVSDSTPSSPNTKARVSSADASRLLASRRSFQSMAPRSSQERRREKVWKAVNQTVAVTGSIVPSLFRPLYPNEDDADGQQRRANAAPGVDHNHSDQHDVENPVIETMDVCDKETDNCEEDGNHVVTQDNSEQQQHSQKKPAPQYNLSNRKNLILRAERAKERQQYGLGCFECCLCRSRANLSTVPTTLTSVTFGAVSCVGISLNQKVLKYLHWTFRSTFLSVVSSFIVVFLFINFAYATFLYVVGEYQPTCIGGANGSILDLFMLSWNTFNTAGYGVNYSPLSSGEPNIRKCIHVTTALAWEAFLGTMYGAFCAAIIYVKISRIQSVAQVAFSTPIVIRFGSGVSVEQDNINNAHSINNNKDDTSATADADSTFHTTENHMTRSKQLSDTSLSELLLLQDTARLPCPIMEFRIANRFCRVDGGELLDSMVNIVASVDSSQACQTLHSSIQKRRRRKHNGGRRSTMRESLAVQRQEKQQERESQDDHKVDREEYLSHANALLSNYLIGQQSISDRQHAESGKGTRLSSHLGGLRSPSRRLQGDQDMREPIAATSTTIARKVSHRHSMVQAFEEDPTGHLVPRRIFAKLDVETSKHPFFERVWTVRHELNDKSPLLRPAAREMVQANGGFWPVELNSAAGVRSAIHFDQILVSFSGTCNADAKSVYTQHVYEWVDLIVGYRFANMLYTTGPTNTATKSSHSKALKKSTSASNHKRPRRKASSRSHSGRYLRNRKEHDSDSENESRDDVNHNGDIEKAGQQPEWFVDLRVLNDVTEQAGGGGEPFPYAVPKTSRDHVAQMLIL